jgi:hypothetical protein
VPFVRLRAEEGHQIAYRNSVSTAHETGWAHQLSMNQSLVPGYLPARMERDDVSRTTVPPG